MRFLNRTSGLPRPTAAGLPVLLALLLTGATPSPSAAQVEGVSYTLTPTYNVLRWDEKLGLEDTELWGGRFALNFGRYIALQSYYLARNDVNTDLTGLPLRDRNGAVLMNQKLDISNYGADLVLNLGTGNIVPFLKGGGGIIQFNPADRDKVKQINVKAGGGFRFGVSRLNAEVYVEDSAFRIDRYDFAAGPMTQFPEDPDADKITHNLSAGVGLNFQLGGYSGSGLTESDRAIRDRFRSGLSGLSIPVEPFVGKLDYADESGLETQDLFGVRTGLDFGRYFGLRGYYWRGVNDDFNHTQPVESYGGEAQFNLSAGQGVTPFLLGGVGHIDFKNDFQAPDGVEAKDKTALIVGGGLSFRLGDRLRLNAEGRDYILSMRNLEKIATTEDLTSNWMISASLGFNLFGNGADGQKGFFAKEEPPAPRPAKTVEEESTPMTKTGEESGSTTVDEMAPPAPEKPGPDGRNEWRWTDDTGRKHRFEGPPPRGERRFEGRMKRPMDRQEIPQTHDYNGDRIIAIPVPTEGEIYIRYGRPGGVNIQSKAESDGSAAQAAPAAPQATPAAPQAAPAPRTTGSNDSGSRMIDRDELRAAIREELEKSGAATSGLTTDQQMELLERRLAERLDRRIDERTASSDNPPPTVVVTDGSSSSDKTSTVKLESGSDYHWSPQALRLYTGAAVDDPGQFILGARMNLGPVTEHSRLDFVPELAAGFGDNVNSTMVGANLQYTFKEVSERGDWSPYAALGAAFINYDAKGKSYDGNDIVVNAMYGVTARIGRLNWFAEHQGIAFFDNNRLLAGVRFRL